MCIIYYRLLVSEQCYLYNYNYVKQCFLCNYNNYYTFV